MLFRKLKKIYWSNYVKSFSLNCYDNIDFLPVYFWFKYQQNNHGRNLLIEPRKETKKAWFYFLSSGRHFRKVETQHLNELWAKIYDQYIELYGFSETFLEILNKEKEIALIRCELIESGDNIFYTHEEIAIQELEALQNKNIGTHNYNETIAAIDNILGTQIDEFKTSVARFYGYIKMIESRNTKEAA